MHRNLFIRSINEKLIIKLTFNSIEKGILTRNCIPFDFGPSRRFRDKSQRYHFLVLDGASGRHNLSILPIQIVKIELTEKHFSPSDFIKWKPNWFIKRNWGVYS
ncbi:hypothetical protein BW723_09145 [Polaribacter reichenbachii]|uniref:WYL domain-containing protein n=1 Tax=Polaribacter reichenbachii TaxID=996801 RepID=A0A1B8U7C2_9FLAO|nr:hypothetical protein [Polaribacter reichenbachii]APZ46451.1 hypothetical protein BW723_09145 [Polaribacter reichenbachii]AUC20316.1 hypothetical protein BTO17_17180 [Polaribacter reichenbachii]OBY67783.1 hypothetical protein LPB301_00355 [Polaribacter reichenbachii]